MLKKHFNYFSMLSTGLFFFILGISFIFGKFSPWNWLYITLIIGVSIIGVLRIANFIMNFRRLKRRFSMFLDVILWIIGIILSLSNAPLFYFLFPRLVGGWISLHAIVKTIKIYIKIKDHLSGWMHSFIFLIGDVVMATILFLAPYRYLFLVDLSVGCYFMIYGGNYVLEYLREILPAHSGATLDRKIQLAVPPFLAAIIPPTLMHMILDKDDDDQVREEFEAVKDDIPVDVEVFVHIAPSGPAMLGHVDIAYRGFLMSYGCYDPHQRRLVGTLGDGVVIVAPKDSYLYNCLVNENKVLVGFGISLNSKQKKDLNKQLLEVFEMFVDFQSDEQLKNKGLSYKGACDDYISRVTQTTPEAKFYKYKEGKLKTFFVLSSNCVFFITNILSCIGLNLVDMSGIVSPGSYFDFLNKQFKSDKSFVISRTIYTKKNAGQFHNDEVS